MSDISIIRDAKATIRFLRFLTDRQGFASMSIFDSGTFDEGTIRISLERDGLLYNSKGDKRFYSPEELLGTTISLMHFGGRNTLEKVNEEYKKHKWNE